MTSLKQVNAAFKTLNIPLTMYRAKEGYYYFIGPFSVPSLYIYNLHDCTLSDVCNHINYEYTEWFQNER